MLSPYAKLISMPSTNNFTIYFNLLKKDSAVSKKEVRQALNCVLNQKNLLDFTYKKEGALNSSALEENRCLLEHEAIEKLLRGLKLNVVTQDSLLFYGKGLSISFLITMSPLSIVLPTAKKRFTIWCSKIILVYKIGTC